LPEFLELRIYIDAYSGEDERRLPFGVKALKTTTRKAIAELEAGKGKRVNSVDALMADLNAGA
jgi:DNA-damage-inducible protein J